MSGSACSIFEVGRGYGGGAMGQEEEGGMGEGGDGLGGRGGADDGVK